MTELQYHVPGISCAHCRAAITAEVQLIPGVVDVQVDLEARLVTVRGDDDVDDAAVRAAIDAAGYDVAGR